MHLTPRESERLMVSTMGDLAAKRKARGVKLNYVETIAYITADIYEKVRDGGMGVLELMEYGAQLLTRNDVMEGVAEMLQPFLSRQHSMMVQSRLPFTTPFDKNTLLY